MTVSPSGTDTKTYADQTVDYAETHGARSVSPSIIARATPQYAPSADQLLFLFDQASKAHDSVAQTIGAKMQDAIAAKNGMTELSTQLGLLHFEGDDKLANATEVIATIKELQGKIKDPEMQEALKAASDIANQGGAPGTTDTLMTSDEMKKMNDIVSNTISTIDSRMQTQTMSLKQENDYFTSITAVIKEIMDSNTKIFNTIMGRG